MSLNLRIHNNNNNNQVSKNEEKEFLKDVIYCVFIIDIYGFYSSLFYGECDARWYLCTGASRKFLHPKKRRIFEEKNEEFFEEKKLKQIKKQFEKGKCMLYHSILK